MFQSAPGLEAGRCTSVRTGGDRRLLCFNPRPALRPGDARRLFTSPCFSVGFNPRPALRPGDAAASSSALSGADAFQSAPGLEAGRCMSIFWPLTTSVSFNPRPALRPGDADTCLPMSVSTISFNPRPALRPGDARPLWGPRLM